MLIALGSDHAGFQLKDRVISFLQSSGINYKDFGVYSEESADYPEQAALVVQAVKSGEFTFGILICGTGIGMSIVANKHRGIRAALCSEPYSARFAREHNNANVLTMGSRVIGPGMAEAIVSIFIHTEFAGGRHERRLSKIETLEQY
ncbi:MAG: ribose 5-phosphate isomerase B [Firmicutes bacterium]|nr:ribose 5-phosphate isomerase B [Bacillota bacterium]